MRTVKEVSRLTGVSIRTLRYYDAIGLLHPAKVSEAGYRLYDDTALERLQQILLFRELEFPLKEIKEILDSEGFDREKALEQQIGLLTLKKERLERLISLARDIKETGVGKLDFTAFDTAKIREYEEQARARWGTTDAWREFEARKKTGETEAGKQAAKGLMEIFMRLGKEIPGGPSSEEAQALVKELQEYITAHFYTCTPKILSGLGKMYGAGEEFTENIDRAAGAGTAAFAAEAIALFCGESREKLF